MNKNLADKLPQSQLEDVNPNLTQFPVLDQHGGVVPLFLQKNGLHKIQIFKTPKYMLQITIGII